MTVTPDGPDVATVAAMGWNPVVGDGEGWSTSCASCRRRLPHRGGGRGRGLGRTVRLGELLLRARPGAAAWRWVRSPRGCILTGGEAGGAGRGRPHRPAPRPPGGPAPQARHRRLLRRPQARRLRRAPPARRRPVRRHGQAHHRRRWSATTCCWSTGATTSCTCPSDQIDAVRHYTGGDSPSCTAWAAATSPSTKAKVRSRGGDVAPGAGGALPEAGARPATRSRGHARGSARWRTPSPSPRRPTSCKAIDDVKADMEARPPHGPPGVRRRRLRQDRGGDPRRVQGGAGRQAGGGARAHHAAGHNSTTRRSASASPPFPVRVEVLSRFLTAGQAKRWPRA
jgi:transcription-repair coupling factor (superfamily II helicase)